MASGPKTTPNDRECWVIDIAIALKNLGRVRRGVLISRVYGIWDPSRAGVVKVRPATWEEIADASQQPAEECRRALEQAAKAFIDHLEDRGIGINDWKSAQDDRDVPDFSELYPRRTVTHLVGENYQTN